jgi:predicted signal transduction protein with EAL and GGDEF domain/DNA-binding response OmpR family regulator
MTTRADEGRTILIADDDPSSTLLAEAALAEAGYRVLIANGGHDALRQLEASRPDCIVLDVMMPDLSGFEVCRRVRARPDGARVPILMLTNLSDHASISESYNAGASDFTQKGRNPRLLVERVRFLLRDRHLEDELITNQLRLQHAQRIARVAHWELSPQGASLSVAPLVGEILSVESSALKHYEDFLGLLAREEASPTRAAFRLCAAGGGSYARDHRLDGPNGQVAFLHQEAELLYPRGDTSEGVVLVTLQDITRLQRAEDTARTLLYTDAATGLPNRLHFAESIAAALALPAGHANTSAIALRIQNLDRAAAAHGEGFSHALVAAVAECARRVLGSACGSMQPAIARLSGDELGIMLRGAMTAERIGSVMLALLAAIARPIECLGIEYVPVASAGIAMATHDGTEAADLIANAHVAANQAADVGGFSFYSEHLQARSRRHLSLESDLRVAIERRQLDLVYQPRILLADCSVAGVEALMRWQHPRVGSVSPAEFIPIAEQAGIINELGNWALQRACGQLASWRSRSLGDFRMAINLSARQLAEPDLPRRVHEALINNGLPAKAVELELTETCVISADVETKARLASLRAMGLHVALDDFGTGYSSLGQIRRLPVDCLKLDRSLIADLRLDRGAQGIVAAVFAIARTLGLRSCAEGVEDAATLEILQGFGCDEAQGYYIAKPLTADGFETWMGQGAARNLRRPSSASGQRDSSAPVSPAKTTRRTA